jgi:hypothetical protein
MGMFNVNDWYWTVIDTGRIFSSKRNTYVGPNDGEFGKWKTFGGNTEPTPIPTESELWYYMKDQLPSWMPPNQFVQPAAGEYNKDQLRGYSLEKRSTTERGGMYSAVAAQQIRTDDHAKQLLTMARLEAAASATYKTRSVGNGLVQFDAPTILAVSSEVDNFVNAVFDTYADMDTQIEVSNVTTLAQIDAAYAAVVPTGP